MCALVVVLGNIYLKTFVWLCKHNVQTSTNLTTCAHHAFQGSKYTEIKASVSLLDVKLGISQITHVANVCQFKFYPPHSHV